jgi:hypothetical protein
MKTVRPRGASSSDPPAQGHHPPASEVALAFLAAMERRDLGAARHYLAPDFSMCFPGGVRMHKLEELVARSGSRYQRVAKDFDHIDECSSSGVTIVYCSGRLRGIWNDGSEFSGIRFIDRFEVVDGLLRRQDVWNDLGELAAGIGRLAPAAQGCPDR